MDHLRQAGVNSGARQGEEQGKLIEFAQRIAQGWADQLNLGTNGVEWVAVRGGRRTPLGSTTASAVVLPLERGNGVAFILGSPGMIDLLFVITCRSTGYSVNISNNAKPWNQSERHDVRHDYAGDMKDLLVAARRYVRRAGVPLP